MNESDTQAIVAKILMWCGWSFIVLTCLMFGFVLAAGAEDANTFDRPLEIFALAFLVGPIVFCGAVRFLALPRIRNPWIQLVVYGVGLMFAQQIMLYGIFLVPEYQVIFFVLCGIAVAINTPFWISRRPPKAPA